MIIFILIGIDRMIDF